MGPSLPRELSSAPSRRTGNLKRTEETGGPQKLCLPRVALEPRPAP